MASGWSCTSMCPRRCNRTEPRIDTDLHGSIQVFRFRSAKIRRIRGRFVSSIRLPEEVDRHACAYQHDKDPDPFLRHFQRVVCAEVATYNSTDDHQDAVCQSEEHTSELQSLRN